jgi:pimeloyl-ACP methyl ester carboxylesterase
MVALERRLIAVEGATLEVFVGGAGGPTVCQSHPFVALPPDGGLVDAVGDLCRLVRVNPRGTGGSSAAQAPRECTLGQHVADLEAVRQRLGVERWAFLGQEGGACTSPLYALQAPHALSGLVIAWMGPSGPRIAADARSLLSPHHPSYEQDVRTAPRRRHPAVLDPAAAPRGEWAQLREGLWMFTRDGRPVVMLPFEIERAKPFLEEFVSDFDVEPRLGEIRVPTLVVASGRDPIVPREECERVAAGLPHARLVVLEASGHGVPNLDRADAEAYRAALRRFLQAGLEG